MKPILLCIALIFSTSGMEKNESDLRKSLKAKVAVFDEQLIVSNPASLKEMPYELVCMTKLIALGLNHNEIERIEHCDNLTSLISLHLDDNHITEIPEHISVMSRLGVLSANRNKIARIDPRIILLSYLQLVELNNNQLHNLPDLCFIQQLRYLDLSYNRLTTLDILGVCVLPVSLQTLNVKNNQLTQLPDNFGSLTQLRSLDISQNPLSTLPDTFSNLRALSELHINKKLLNTNNAIELICKNKQLKKLHVKIE
jgi:Leucine-rich repeat (LRR) protein